MLTPMVRNPVRLVGLCRFYTYGIISRRYSSSDSSLARLNKVLNVFSNDDLSLQSKARRCIDVYDGISITLLEDLFKSEKRNGDIIKVFRSKIQASSLIRNVCYRDLIQILKNGSYNILGGILDELLDNKVITGEFFLDKIIDSSEEDKVANKIIMLMASFGDLSMSCLTAVSLRDQGFRIDHATLKALINLLCLSNRKLRTHHNFALVKIIHEFPELEYSPKELSKIISASIADDSNCFLLNIIFKMLYSSIITHSDNKELSKALVNLILANLDNAHLGTATNIILELKNFEDVIGDSELQVRFLSTVEEGTARDVLPIFLFDMSDLKLLNFLLEFHRKDPEKFQATLKHLQLPADRLTLSVLFSVFVKGNKDLEARDILQHILKSDMGINDKDFDTIITKLLSSGKVSVAVSMVLSKKIAVAKSAYITIFQYLLENDLLHENGIFLIEMVTQLKIAVDDPVIFRILPILVKYLASKVHPLVARSFLIKLFNKGNHPNMSQIFNLKEFHLPDDLLDITKMSNGNKIESLRIILGESIEREEFDLVKWCIQELRNHGQSIHEITSFMSIKYGYFCNKVFREDLMKGI